MANSTTTRKNRGRNNFVQHTLYEVIRDSSLVGIAAQNCANKESGAYTGEISASMVKSTGATYVILGHSERRAYYGETNALLKEKIV